MRKRTLNQVLWAEALAIIALIVLLLAGLPLKTIDYWVERYQTLLAALVALAGGSFVLLAARAQVRHAEKVAEQIERNRKEEAQEEIIRALRACLSDIERLDHTMKLALQRALGQLIGTGGLPANLQIAERPQWLSGMVARLPTRYALLVGRCYDWAGEVVQHAINLAPAAHFIEQRLCWAGLARYVLATAIVKGEAEQILPSTLYPPDEVVLAHAVKFNLSVSELDLLKSLLLIDPATLPDLKQELERETLKRAFPPNEAKPSEFHEAKQR